jgi:hypothetical protein
VVAVSCVWSTAAPFLSFLSFLASPISQMSSREPDRIAG